MEAKAKQGHTPGPWKAEWGWQTDCGRREGWHIQKPVNEGEFVSIAEIEYDSGYMDGPEDEANAHLMATAPELLEACKAVIRWARCERECFRKHQYDFVKLARAAIAKATRPDES